MKLKQIPNNTVVHTPTEEDAKVLLAILHENGYTYCDGESLLDNDWLIDLYDKNNELECLGIEPYTKITKHIEHCNIGWFRKQGYTILTLAEFKERYCEEEKPQPKFKVDDRVKVVGYQENCIAEMSPHVGEVGTITKVSEADGYYKITCDNGRFWWHEDWLEPYTESGAKAEAKAETKDTMELNSETLTDDCKSSVKVEKELNLVELIGDRDGIHVYCPTCGEVTLQAWDRGKNTKPLIFAQTDTSIVVRTFANGKAYVSGECVIFPSRALYEQYPLDPYTAWMKWQEEQTIYHIRIEFQPYDERGEMKCGNTGTLHFDDLKFRTPTDRDKCIEEIKAIIEKYSNR